MRTMHREPRRPSQPRRTRSNEAPGERSERGAAIVEVALLVPILAMLVFSAVDLGRTAQVQNRMMNSAREGAAIAQFSPTSVNTACRGDRNVVDRTRKQNPTLASYPGYTVTVAKKNPSTGVLTPYTGCSTTTPAMTFTSGDHVVVTVTANVAMSGPLSSVTTGKVLKLSRSVEVVVQG